MGQFSNKIICNFQGLFVAWPKIPYKKTGLGAEGEEKAILPSPDDCNVYFYL
jgi:hypothetical protein